MMMLGSAGTQVTGVRAQHPRPDKSVSFSNTTRYLLHLFLPPIHECSLTKIVVFDEHVHVWKRPSHFLADTLAFLTSPSTSSTPRQRCWSSTPGLLSSGIQASFRWYASQMCSIVSFSFSFILECPRDVVFLPMTLPLFSSPSSYCNDAWSFVQDSADMHQHNLPASSSRNLMRSLIRLHAELRLLPTCRNPFTYPWLLHYLRLLPPQEKGPALPPSKLGIHELTL